MTSAIVFYLNGEKTPWTAIRRPAGPFSVRIGRGTESDLTLPSDADPKALASVSRVHCRIFGSGGQVQLEDLGSQNFSSLNGQIVLAPTPLAFPANIRLGSFELQVREESLQPDRIDELRQNGVGIDSGRSETRDALSVHGQVWTQLRESSRWTHALIQETNLVTRFQRADDFMAELESTFTDLFDAKDVSVQLQVDSDALMAELDALGFGKPRRQEIELALQRTESGSPAHPVLNEKSGAIVWIVRPIKPALGAGGAVVARFGEEVPSQVRSPAADAFVAQAVWIAQAIGNLLLELEAGRASASETDVHLPSPQTFLACETAELWGTSPQFNRYIYEAEIAATRYVNIVERPGKVPTVFIQGESGTGKSALARLAHSLSKRSAGPFVDLNCSAIPVTLAESELFGYERGAHDKAFQAKPGQFELAARGSLFLDEIGKTPLDFQSKLLKVLDTGEYTRVGGTRPLKVDCNVYVAESEDAQEMCDRGQMLPELWYRIRAFTILVPPLRDRTEDIGVIASKCIDRLNANAGATSSKCLSPELIRAFAAYSWPGNIRELTQSVEVAFALCPAHVEEIALNHLPESIKGLFGIDRGNGAAATVDTTRELDELLNELERQYFAKLMAECDGNVSEVTRRSGKSYNTVQSKLKDLRKWIAGCKQRGELHHVESLQQLAGDAWADLFE